MEFETIITNRLILRKITPEVHRFVHETFSDEALRAFFGITSEKGFVREKKMYEDGLTTFNKSFLWFHLLDKTTGRHLGWCGYHTWYTGHARAEIGYSLYDDDDKGKGLMTEAMRAILDFGFDEMKLNRVEALIADYNTPSLKLVHRFGFRKEGVLRGHYFVDGIAEDSVVFGLLASEYRR